MTTDKTIKVGVIGVGVMGYNHARVYAELPGAELVGVYDVDKQTAQSASEKLKTKNFDTLKDFYASGVEAVTIAVPTSLHRQLVLEAFERGTHVLIEKPIAGTLDDAKEIIYASEKMGKKLMVGHIERFNPVITCIKSMVHKDEIISINIVRVGPLPPRVKDAGIIVDLAVHDIDLVRYLTEVEVKNIYAVTSSNIAQYEDTAALLLDLGDGVSALITTNWITPYKSREIQIITKERLIRGNLITQQVREYSHFQSQEQSFVVRDLHIKHEEPLKLELAAFLNAIRNNSPMPINGQDGYESLRLAIRALESQK
jgi:predicted dehydrogenase